MANAQEMLDTLIQLFDWVEYTVFGSSLFICMLIGVYFGFIKKAGHDTVEGYMFGGRQMKLLPVSLSLIASFISGITILGIPAEVYEYGTLVLGAVVGMTINGVISATCFIPVFYKLQLLSLNEYLERRFDRRIRITASILYIFNHLIWVALAVYVPALAINLVTGLNIHIVTTTASLVCIFYTTVGGLKAVVWADTIQTVLMVGSLLVIMIAGTKDVGGFYNVIETAEKSGRLEFFVMDPSPTIRISFWSSCLGYAVFWTYATGVSSAMVQRFLSLPTKQLAIQSVFWYVLGCCFFFVSAGYIGLAMYTKYQHCDPLISGLARKPEQIMPMFVLQSAGHLRAIPGLFLSCVFAAALSTMSTTMTACAALVYEDFLVPCMKTTLTDSTASRYMKWLTFIIGIITVAMVFLVEQLGAVHELSSMFGGAISGIHVGMFTLGLFFPKANVMGMLWGFGVSFTYLAWTIVGFNYYNKSGMIRYKKKPLSVDGCPFNVTQIQPWDDSIEDPYVFPVYRLTIFYYSVVSFIITVAIGYVVSLMSGGRKSTMAEKDLFHPIVHGFLIQKNEPPLRMKTKGYIGVAIQEITS